ncbi:MAG TPA: hypothetical protein VL418_02805 [Devosiaceae bacterium]|jgi:predicted DNA-binding transcriptional regulator AlpA|nr:hypothetical protein [Devosiaceae bacterium]
MAGTSIREASIPRFAMRCDEAAASVGVSESTFKNWIALGRMPKGHKIDGVVLWDTEQVRAAWIALRDADNDDEANPFDGVVA